MNICKNDEYDKKTILFVDDCTAIDGKCSGRDGAKDSEQWMPQQDTRLHGWMDTCDRSWER